MNPYEPPQTEPAKLDGPSGPSSWIWFIFGFPLLLVIVLLLLLG